jgi:hypothetical protein
MVQVIFDRWCARVLMTLPLMCLRHRMPVLGQQPLDLMGQHPLSLLGPLLSFHHSHCHLYRP